MSEHPVTLTDRIRAITVTLMSTLGTALFRMGIHPDAITILGFLVVLVAAVFIGRGQLQVGGVILVVGLPLDAVDGAVARAMQRKDRFGAMLDSSLDRYADGLIFSALSYYFAVENDHTLLLLSLAALVGSFMVSYARARGEGVDVDVRVGWFSRLERIVIILLILIVPQTVEIGLWVLAIGTNITAIQRLWYVHKTLRERHYEGD